MFPRPPFGTSFFFFLWESAKKISDGGLFAIKGPGWIGCWSHLWTLNFCMDVSGFSSLKDGISLGWFFMAGEGKCNHCRGYVEYPEHKISETGKLTHVAFFFRGGCLIKQSRIEQSCRCSWESKWIRDDWNTRVAHVSVTFICSLITWNNSFSVHTIDDNIMYSCLSWPVWPYNRSCTHIKPSKSLCFSFFPSHFRDVQFKILGSSRQCIYICCFMSFFPQPPKLHHLPCRIQARIAIQSRNFARLFLVTLNQLASKALASNSDTSITKVNPSTTLSIFRPWPMDSCRLRLRTFNPRPEKPRRQTGRPPSPINTLHCRCIRLATVQWYSWDGELMNEGWNAGVSDCCGNLGAMKGEVLVLF